MSACPQPDKATFEPGPARGVTPPLLPTLIMAAILGAGSYLCREPAPARVPVPATALAAAPEATAEAPFIPAPLAFQTQFPMILAAQAEPAPSGHAASAQAEPAGSVQARKAPTRTARLAARRPEGPRGIARAPERPLGAAVPASDKLSPDKLSPDTSLPDRSLPFAAEVEETGIVAASDEDALPAIALPFAPTIRAVTRAGAAAGAFVGAGSAALGAETASLGAAVTGWVGRLR